MDIENLRVINAAGKLTALGGSAQTKVVADSQSKAAMLQVDLQQLRQNVAAEIAEYCDAEAACITSGAAAGICISIAALICTDSEALIHRLPKLPAAKTVVLQAGHNINFGAHIEQMIHMTGADCVIAGTEKEVTTEQLATALNDGPMAYLFVQSHHCLQDNRLSIETCISLAKERNVPIVVDAAAEEDLQKYVKLGADLVTYSGGKAFGGPTSGFIVGRKNLVELCEQQFKGIARPMKVSKEQLAGLSVAMRQYRAQDHVSVRQRWDRLSRLLFQALENSPFYGVSTRKDEAGRDFERVCISPIDGSFSCQTLVRFLAACNPSIRTRNHQVNQDRILVDPRELDEDDMQIIISRLADFESNQ